MSAPEISVVIPVYNEASIVRDAVHDLGRKLDALGWDYEIVLAENGSRDGTEDALRQLALSDPRVRWFHEEQPNYGRALKRGRRISNQDSFQAVLVQDARQAKEDRPGIHSGSLL